MFTKFVTIILTLSDSFPGGFFISRSNPSFFSSPERDWNLTYIPNSIFNI